MSRLDPKVQAANKKWFARVDARQNELRAMADREIMQWLRENPIIGELQTEKGKSYYYWNYVSDSKVEVLPFTTLSETH